MTLQLSLLDPKHLEGEFLLSAQRRATEQLLKNVKSYSDISASPEVKQTQNPNHVISLMGERGTGKTTVLLHLIEKLREDERWLVPPIFLPDLVLEAAALAPAIVSHIQDAFEKEAEELNINVTEAIEDIELRLAWFADNKFSQDIIARDSVNSRDFARQTFQFFGEAWQISTIFKQWLSKLLTQTKKQNLILVFDDADISIDNVEQIIDFVRYYLSIPEVITIFSADEEQLAAEIAEQAAFRARHSGYPPRKRRVFAVRHVGRGLQAPRG